MGTLISALYFLILGLAALFGWHKGKKYVWQYTLTRLIINVLAVIIAVPLTKKLSLIIAGALFGALPKDLFGKEDVFALVPSLKEIFTVLIAMAVGLILFFFVRLIIKNILKLFAPLLSSLLIYATDLKGGKDKHGGDALNSPETTEEKASEILADGVSSPEAETSAASAESLALSSSAPEEIVGAPEEKSEPPRRTSKREGCFALKPQPLSIVIGIVGCMLGVLFVFAPFTGLIGTVDTAVSSVDEKALADAGVDTSILDAVKDFTSNASVRVTNALGGRLIFNSLTKYKVGGSKIKLEDEITLAAAVSSNASALTDKNSASGERVDALDEVLSAFDSSSLIPLILSDVINSAGARLSAGEEFMGIKPPSENGSDDMSAVLLKEVILAYDGCTPDSIKGDVKTAGKALRIIVERDALTKLEAPKELLSDKELMTALLSELLSNDRLSSLTSTLVEMGVVMLEDGLGVPETLTSKHSELTTALAALDTSLSAAELTAEVEGVLKSFGIDVTESGAAIVSLYLKSGTEPSLSLRLVEINVGGAKKTVDLSSPSAYETHSLLMTKGKVEITHKDSISNPEREAKLIAEALSLIIELSDSIGGNGVSEKMSSVLTPAGKLLDALAQTEMVGKAVVDELILVIFQSEKAGEALPMNKVEVTHFVNSLISGTKNGKGYTEVMLGISEMVDVLERLQGGEDMGEGDAVADALKNLSPESAEALSHVVTPDFVSQLGIDAESSEAVANVLGSLFDHVANAKHDGEDGLGLSDEEYQRETEMISSMLDSTMSMVDGERKDLVEVGSFASSVMDSKILTKTVIDSVYGDDGKLTVDPMNTGKEFTESEKTELLATLNERLDEAKSADYETDEERTSAIAETERLAIAIGAYMNAELEIESGEVVFKAN